MSLQNFIAEKVSLPISDLLLGQSIHKHLKFLQESQYWTDEQIYEYQNKKLRQLITHTYNCVPFYKEFFDKLNLKPKDIQTQEDLVKLPIISKNDLRNNKDKWFATNYSKKSLLSMSSSGSTGEPFQFYKTPHSESFSKAVAIRAWYWMNYRLGDKYVKTSIHNRTNLIKKLQDKINNSLFVSFVDFTPAEFRKIISDIEKYKPLFLRAYPTPLMFLAKQIANDTGKYMGKSLVAINTTGSTLFDQDRDFIQKVFGVPIFDSYSCEGSAYFAQCDLQTYHPSHEYAISEFIADKYSIQDKEQPFRHITTDLHNYANPFIRYDTQDYVVLGEDCKCKCGRNMKNIKKIKGRDTDILVSPSGKYILMENIYGYFEDKPQILQIQVIQDTASSMNMNLVVSEECSNIQIEQIESYWKNFIGNDVDFQINIVSDIPLTPSGKRRTIIRNSNIILP